MAATRFDPLHFSRQALTEHRFVELTLHVLDERQQWGRILSEQEDIDDRRILTFPAMERVIDDLPITVRCGWVSGFRRTATLDGSVKQTGGGIVEGQVADLLTRFSRSAIGKAYMRIRRSLRSAGRTLPVGMVYHFNRIPGGWILHDGDFATGQERIIPTDFGFVRLEPYRGVLQAIAANLRSPGGSGLNGSVLNGGTQQADEAVDAGIQRRYGRTAAAAVLRVLARFCATHVTGSDQRRIQRRDGRNWIVYGQAEMAGELGYSRRAVQQAIKTLKDDGVLESASGFSGEGNPSGWRVHLDELAAGPTR